MTSSKTRLLGAVGYPNRVARTPMLMSIFAEATGQDFSYLLFEFPPEQLQQAVEGLKALGAAGFNVTMPYKQAIIEYLDGMDEEAEQLNAVNTVRIDESGKLFGYNTDYYGFRKSLRDANVPVEGSRVAVIGAGAVSGPVALALEKEKAGHVVWLNKTPEKAEACAAVMNARRPGVAESAILTPDHLNREIRNSDIIVDITPVGMATNDVKEHAFDANLMNPSKFVYHVVYAPWETPILRTARIHGAQIMNGARMSLNQAARAFEIWTGASIDDDTLARALKCIEEDVRG